MKYEVIRSGRKTLSAQINDGRLIIRAPYSASDDDIRQFLLRHKAWIEKNLSAAREEQNVKRLTEDELRTIVEQARKIIPDRVRHYAPLVGVSYGRVTIRSQRTLWGSCSSRGNLNFNCMLVMTPPEVLDSVVVHELCHRKEMNHSARFYAELLRVCPEYRECRKWLLKNGKELIGMLPRR